MGGLSCGGEGGGGSQERTKEAPNEGYLGGEGGIKDKGPWGLETQGTHEGD